LLLTTCLPLLLLSGCSVPQETGETVNIAEALSSDVGDTCYDQARLPGVLNFPRDYGPHPTFKTEWWYYTGNLKARGGRHFGFQLTFFRQALDCDVADGPSAWRTNQLYFAHFAVTDTENNRFLSAQRMNRGSLGIAGTQAVPFKTWIDDWQSAAVDGGKGDLLLTARARADKEPGRPDFSISLTLTHQKPKILQGDRGLSRKGPGPADASHYYSFPGMKAVGAVTVAGETIGVEGYSWFDHEWSTAALGADVTGWDWFAIHLDKGPLTGADLMVCQVRNREGEPNGYGFGSISFADGRFVILRESQFLITPDRYWKSPDTGRTYPAGWTVVLQEQNLSLDISPVMDGQEHTHMFPYYEGAVRVRDGSGLGYVEMTGY
jgi:predicted secreted hydrolase